MGLGWALPAPGTLPHTSLMKLQILSLVFIGPLSNGIAFEKHGQTCIQMFTCTTEHLTSESSLVTRY